LLKWPQTPQLLTFFVLSHNQNSQPHDGLPDLDALMKTRVSNLTLSARFPFLSFPLPPSPPPSSPSSPSLVPWPAPSMFAIPAARVAHSMGEFIRPDAEKYTPVFVPATPIQDPLCRFKPGGTGFPAAPSSSCTKCSRHSRATSALPPWQPS
jgi:hypothetical protein